MSRSRTTIGTMVSNDPYQGGFGLHERGVFLIRAMLFKRGVWGVYLCTIFRLFFLFFVVAYYQGASSGRVGIFSFSRLKYLFLRLFSHWVGRRVARTGGEVFQFFSSVSHGHYAIFFASCAIRYG